MTRLIVIITHSKWRRAHFQFVLIVGLLVNLSWPAFLRAEPKLSETYKYYQIKGDSVGALKRQMNRRSGIKENGKTYWAYTSWQVKWNYKYRETDDACAIQSVAATIDVRYTMPRWQASDAASAKLSQEWRRFYAALLKHELGHRDFGVRAARDVEKTLASFRTFPTCAALETAVDQAGQAAIDIHIAAEKQYDIRTHHGRTQGAVLH